RSFLKRDTLLAAAAIYKELHGKPDGTIPATFQIGWKPDVSQSKPKPRGSATMSLKE
ncbi:11815_t:CDS:2, partial [Racocetra persica]